MPSSIDGSQRSGSTNGTQSTKKRKSFLGIKRRSNKKNKQGAKTFGDNNSETASEKSIDRHGSNGNQRSFLGKFFKQKGKQGAKTFGDDDNSSKRSQNDHPESQDTSRHGILLIDEPKEKLTDPQYQEYQDLGKYDPDNPDRITSEPHVENTPNGLAEANFPDKKDPDVEKGTVHFFDASQIASSTSGSQQGSFTPSKAKEAAIGSPQGSTESNAFSFNLNDLSGSEAGSMTYSYSDSSQSSVKSSLMLSTDGSMVYSPSVGDSGSPDTPPSPSGSKAGSKISQWDQEVKEVLGLPEVLIKDDFSYSPDSSAAGSVSHYVSPNSSEGSFFPEKNPLNPSNPTALSSAGSSPRYNHVSSPDTPPSPSGSEAGSERSSKVEDTPQQFQQQSTDAPELTSPNHAKSSNSKTPQRPKRDRAKMRGNKPKKYATLKDRLIEDIKLHAELLIYKSSIKTADDAQKMLEDPKFIEVIDEIQKSDALKSASTKLSERVDFQESIEFNVQEPTKQVEQDTIEKQDEQDTLKKRRDAFTHDKAKAFFKIFAQICAIQKDFTIEDMEILKEPKALEKVFETFEITPDKNNSDVALYHNVMTELRETAKQKEDTQATPQGAEEMHATPKEPKKDSGIEEAKSFEPQNPATASESARPENPSVDQDRLDNEMLEEMVKSLEDDIAYTTSSGHNVITKAPEDIKPSTAGTVSQDNELSNAAHTYSKVRRQYGDHSQEFNDYHKGMMEHLQRQGKAEAFLKTVQAFDTQLENYINEAVADYSYKTDPKNEEIAPQDLDQYHENMLKAVNEYTGLPYDKFLERVEQHRQQEARDQASFMETYKEAFEAYPEEDKEEFDKMIGDMTEEDKKQAAETIKQRNALQIDLAGAVTARRAALKKTSNYE